MPKNKAFSLSGMVDTDVEEDATTVDVFPSPDSNQENKGAKRKGGRPKANAKRFTKPKRLSGDSVPAKLEATRQTKAGRKRAPLKEQANLPIPSEADEIDEFARSDIGTTTKQLKGTTAGTKRKATEKPSGRPAKAQTTKRIGAPEKDGEFEYTPVQQKKSANVPMSTLHEPREAKSAGSNVEREIAETQAAGEAETMGLRDEEEQEEGSLSPPIVRRSKNSQAKPKSRQMNPIRRRAGTVSDVEQPAGDPVLRRRLGDMTRKYENLDNKYRDLKEIGIKEAELNYEKLRKQSEINAKAANDLIASLKKEIDMQKAIAQEAQSYQSQAQIHAADLSKTRKMAEQVSKSLSEAQNENKILQAKLANSRSASLAVDRTPGSTMRGRNPGQSKVIASNTSEAGSLTQVAQLKEDLYSDLTGLILRGVEIGTEADTFDCIQTGRNGTLHFKLAIAKDTEESYENTEFQYSPRLDENRDRALIELLPEYLTDEITFSRVNAAMFYGRVVDTLMKRAPIDAQE